MERATDILLNTVFLDNEDQYDSRDAAHAEEPSRGKRKPKKQPQKKNVVWASGQLQHGYANESFDAYGSSDLTTVPFNYWHQYDDKVERIQPIFPTVRRAIVHQCVQSCRGNEIAAVGMIMEKEPAASPAIEQDWNDVKTLEQIKEGLTALLTDRTQVQIKRIAVGVVVHADRRQSVEQMIQEGINFAFTYETQQEARARRIEQQKLPKSTRLEVSDMPVIPDYLRERTDSKSCPRRSRRMP